MKHNERLYINSVTGSTGIFTALVTLHITNIKLKDELIPYLKILINYCCHVIRYVDTENYSQYRSGKNLR